MVCIIRRRPVGFICHKKHRVKYETCSIFLFYANIYKIYVHVSTSTTSSFSQSVTVRLLMIESKMIINIFFLLSKHRKKCYKNWENKTKCNIKTKKNIIKKPNNLWVTIIYSDIVRGFIHVKYKCITYHKHWLSGNRNKKRVYKTMGLSST